MPTRDPLIVYANQRSLEAGMDSGRAPNLLAPNLSAFLVNGTVRGGWPYPRPGYKQCTLDFGGVGGAETAFQEALFQLAGGYEASDGGGNIISMQSGRQWRLNLNRGNTFQVQEITIPGDPNSPTRPRAWWCQAENYFLIQDGQSPCWIYNGGSARRAQPAQREVPVGQMMTYYMGRLGLAQGRFYLFGDLVNNGSTTILQFTENDYLNEGGSFAVPAPCGNITGFKAIASVNTALGTGELIVTTTSKSFATTLPKDRATWKNTTQLLQRVIKLSNSAMAQDSLVAVNQDLFFRARNDINSIIYSVRNAGQWGNRGISKEMNRVLSHDPEDFLEYSSGVNFDNRLLMTTSPGIVRERGVYHRGLVALDFEILNSMRDDMQPAWDGLWTGLRILKILTVEHYGVERCFAFALGLNDKIELWEITKDAQFDNDGEDKRIVWSMESRAFDFQPESNSIDQKMLQGGDLFFDRVVGNVHFEIEFRPDEYACWVPWDQWDECANWKMCEFENCPTLPNYQEQYRPKRQLVQPPETFNPQTGEQYRTFYELQTRLTVTGFARLKQHRYRASLMQNQPVGKQM